MVDIDALEQLLRRIEDTGDHPLGGEFCPGRHRAAWTVARVHVDARRPREVGSRAAHRTGWWVEGLCSDWDARQLGLRISEGIRRRLRRVRDFPQLGTRVPPELYERLQRCSAETGVTQAFLVQRGIEGELAARGR